MKGVLKGGGGIVWTVVHVHKWNYTWRRQWTELILMRKFLFNHAQKVFIIWQLFYLHVAPWYINNRVSKRWHPIFWKEWRRNKREIKRGKTPFDFFFRNEEKVAPRMIFVYWASCALALPFFSLTILLEEII
jgi:hypothetical protein